MSKYLTFLTVTSGHTQVNDRTAVKQFAVSSLLALVRQGGGAIPGVPGWAVRITFLDGGAFFSINHGPDILAAGGVAYTSAGAVTLWPELEQLHLANYEGFLKLGGLTHLPPNWLGTSQCPQKLPWLAVVLQPGIALYPLAAFWLADFEQCLAWTIIETAAPPSN